MATGEGHTTIVKGMVQCTVDLNGKTALITGANCGIGFETALDLASRGARVIMACRDVTRAEDAKAKILEEIKNANLVIKQLDLSSLASVKQCADDIIESESKLHLLINNAGVMLCPPSKTKDGFEMHLGVNHVGHFLLSYLLLDLLKKSAPSRIVIVSAAAYKFTKMNWDDLMYEKNYHAVHAYSQSKLANIHHCLELSRRLEGTGVTCYALHPGIILKTELGRHILGDTSHLPFFWRLLVKVSSPFAGLSKMTPRKGAQTTLYCALAPELAKTSGKFYDNCAEVILADYAQNKDDAKRMWKLSEGWVKDYLPQTTEDNTQEP